MTELPSLFATFPAVYAVKDRYIITVPVNAESVMWVKVGRKTYYDDSNGVLRSASRTHKMEVPMKALDAAGKYTVCWREVRERKPYFSDLSGVRTCAFSFRPVRGDKVCLYHIADAHNRVDAPVAAGTYFGEDLDLLVLNGDIPNHSGNIEYFTAIHEIAGKITHGELPVIFSRGNHDTRGIYAEALPDYTPTDNGKSYYTVRLGPVWAVVLDCGEDKPDNHKEYGHTVCCEDFRKRETAFLREVARYPKTEYDAPGVRYRLVIVHNPFPETLNPPFDIEVPTYTAWCRLLREKVRPDLMLCGHIHQCYVTRPGDEKDRKGTPCPIVVASRIHSKESEFFEGGAVTLEPGRATVRFTDQSHAVLGEEEIIL